MKHRCATEIQWTLNRRSSPRINLLCDTCGKELRSIYLDDLEEDDLAFFTRILKLHRKYRKEKYGDEGDDGNE